MAQETLDVVFVHLAFGQKRNVEGFSEHSGDATVQLVIGSMA